jgi:hypothetical protein
MMGIAIFIVLAFVMLGVERLVAHLGRSYPARHGVTRRS